MRKPKPIAGRISTSARDEMRKQLEHASFPGAVLCLLKVQFGKVERGVNIVEPEDKWTLGVYGPENIQGLEPQYVQIGHDLLYQIEDVVIAIPQYHLLDEIIGKEMDVVAGTVVFRN